MEISGLQFILEIDENHRTKKVLANDAFKNVLSSMNGSVLIRMNFQRIYKDINHPDGKGEIPAGENANEYMYNSEYYKEFLELLYESLTNALLHNSKEFRQNYIMDLFNRSLKNKVSKIKSSTSYNSKYISAFRKKLEQTDSKSKKVRYQKEINLIENIQNTNSKSLTELIDAIEFIKSDQNFLRLFEIKNTYRPKFVGDKNIPLGKVLELLDLLDRDSVSELISFMYKINIISDYYQSNDKIYVSWKDLSEIIIKFEGNLELTNVLILYYLELEESYESIITRMLEHSKKLIPNEDKYRICMENEIKKISGPLNKIVNDLEQEKNKLRKANSKLEKLSIDFRSIQLSYNKAIDGELGHERSPLNIEFNQNRLKGVNWLDKYDSDSDSNEDEDE